MTGTLISFSPPAVRRRGTKHTIFCFRTRGMGNHWINVRLVGTRSNRAGIGAEIQVDLMTADGYKESRHRVVSSGSSFGGNSLATTVGLGSNTLITQLQVYWPASGQSAGYSTRSPLTRLSKSRKGKNIPSCQVVAYQSSPGETQGRSRVHHHSQADSDESRALQHRGLKDAR